MKSYARHLPVGSRKVEGFAETSVVGVVTPTNATRTAPLVTTTYGENTSAPSASADFLLTKLQLVVRNFARPTFENMAAMP